MAELKVTVKREGEELVSTYWLSWERRVLQSKTAWTMAECRPALVRFFLMSSNKKKSWWQPTIRIRAWCLAEVGSGLARLSSRIDRFYGSEEGQDGHDCLGLRELGRQLEENTMNQLIITFMTWPSLPSWTDYEATAGREDYQQILVWPLGTETHPTLTKMSLFLPWVGSSWWWDSARCGDRLGCPFYYQLASGCKIFCLWPEWCLAVPSLKILSSTRVHGKLIHVAPGDLLGVWRLGQTSSLANVLADILIHLTEDAYHLVKTRLSHHGGIIKTSGIWYVNQRNLQIFLETPHEFKGVECLCLQKTKDISGWLEARIQQYFCKKFG